MTRIYLSQTLKSGAFVALFVAILGGEANAQLKMGPAPVGDADKVAMAAIKNAEHPCPKIVTASRVSDGSIRATCSNKEAYRVFAVNGEVIAMRCSAAERLGVSGC